MRCDAPYPKVLSTPYYDLELGDYSWIMDVPCGKCLPCKRKMQIEWLFRLEQEINVCNSVFFVTFTYETPPMTPKGYMTLKKSDMVKYWKRLRRAHDKSEKIYLSEVAKKKYTKYERKPVKYFMCGEYGTDFYRPHHHAIIFNANPVDIEKYWSTYDSKTGERKSLGWVYNDLTRQVTPGAIRYVLNYINKSEKIVEYDYLLKLFKTDYKKRPDFDGIDEYRHMSKGLGMSFMDQPEIEKYKDGTLNKVPLSCGKEIAIPRYYVKKLFTPHQRSVRAIEHLEEMSLEKSILEANSDDYYLDLYRQKIIRWQKVKRNAQQHRKDV